MAGLLDIFYGCNKENWKKPSENLKNKAEFPQLDAF